MDTIIIIRIIMAKLSDLRIIKKITNNHLLMLKMILLLTFFDIDIYNSFY